MDEFEIFQDACKAEVYYREEEQLRRNGYYE